MSSHVLLNLINELWKKDKIRGFLISIIHAHECLDSIYHMTLTLLLNHIFGMKT